LRKYCTVFSAHSNPFHIFEQSKLGYADAEGESPISKGYYPMAILLPGVEEECTTGNLKATKPYVILGIKYI